MSGDTLSLRECADRLGVHYMTAYKYVRHGRLAATKVGTEWRVAVSDLEELLRGPVSGGPAPWADRLSARLIAGDNTGAWGVVEAAMSSGLEPAGIYERLLAPAMRDIGDGWARGTVSIDEEHRAVATAMRIVGRLGPRFVRRGTPRGRLVIGTPPGERHSLPVTMAADHFRSAGWSVVELGADLPITDFVSSVRRSLPIAAVAISVTIESSVRSAHELIRSLRFAELGPIVLGGAAASPEAALRLGVDAWACDGPGGVGALERLSSSS